MRDVDFWEKEDMMGNRSLMEVKLATMTSETHLKESIVCGKNLKVFGSDRNA